MLIMVTITDICFKRNLYPQAESSYIPCILLHGGVV